MKIAALFSGGKDSTYSIFLAKQMGHEISCLLNIVPYSDESLIFHYPNVRLTSLLSQSLNIPLLHAATTGIEKTTEISILDSLILNSIEKYSISGLVHGGINSNFQRRIFQKICDKYDIQLISPIWKTNPNDYLSSLIEDGFKVMITSVSAMGLDVKWLGVVLDGKSLSELKYLSEKYQFNLTFEGGEGETLVLDCPLYTKKLHITKFVKKWDGQRGTFEILNAILINK